MSQDFSKGKIYKITNDYNDDVYVGSTCDTLVKRFSTHKRQINSSLKMNRPLYTLMREIGFDRFRIELIENYQCEDKYQLRQREGYYIRELGTLNMRIAGRTNTEYQQEHKEYYQNIKKKSAEKYSEENVIRKKLWYETNKEKLLKESSEIIICACGCELAKGALLRHQKTKKHINLLQQQLTVQTV